MDPIGRVEIMFEDVSRKYDAVMEYVIEIPNIQKTLRDHTERFERLELKVDIIESVVKEHVQKFKEIDKRFDKLEEKFDNHTHETIVQRAK